MRHATAKVDINLPVNHVWEKLKDLSLAHRYVPGILDTRITSTQKEGLGASRNVYQSGGRFLQETVVDWQEGRGFTLKLHKGEKDAPFKNASFRYEIEAIDAMRTRLTATMSYTPPLGVVGTLLDDVMLNRIISKVITKVAWSFKHYYETGQTADKSTLRRFMRGAA